MKKSARRRPDPTRARNLLHDHPLLAKGGAHSKPRKAERRKARVALRGEWPGPDLLRGDPGQAIRTDGHLTATTHA